MQDGIYLSVITPCYNGEKYIESAILSVLNQPVSGIEMIVINDGSSDSTAEICKKYSGKIRYIETENHGAGYARNVGIMQAKGKWIGFLDSDDLFLADSFTDEIFKELHRLEENEVDVVYTPYIYSDMELKFRVNVELSEEPQFISHIPKHEFWTCLYKRQFLIKNNICFYEYREQDIATAFRYRVFSQSPKVVTENKMFFLLQRDNPVSNTHTWKQRTMHSVKAAVYFDLYENHANERSREWLFDVAAEQIRLYYGCVLKEGYSSVSEKQRMSCLVSKCLKEREELSRSFQNIKYIYVSAVIDKIVRKYSIEGRKKTSDQLQREDSIQIIERLKTLSVFLRS